MPAIGDRNPLSIQYLDYSGERKSVGGIYSGEITALTIAGFLSAFGDLQTALDAVTLGTRSQQRWGEESVISNTRPASKAAQIETEMLVYYMGATTEQPFSFRIPTVDYTAFNYADPPAGDTVIISGAGATTATTDLVDAIEALCKSPNDPTEAVVVTGMKVVR